MGTLAYALGGGLQGLGKGAEEVGKQAHEEQMLQKQSDLATDRETTIARLKDKFEKENIENQQQFQLKGAQAGREFAVGQQHEKLASEEKIASGAQATRRYASEQSRAGRENAAKTLAGSREAASNKPKPWQIKNVTVYPTDPTTGKIDFTQPPQTKPLHFNPNTNKLYAQMGDKMVLWDSNKNEPAIDPSALNRDVDSRELQALYANPQGVIPSAYKNGGMTNMEAFEHVHHFLPVGIDSRVQAGGMGTTGAATGASDLQDQQVTQGGDDEEEGGNPTTYAEYGDRGPQASDNTPAKE